MKTDDEKRYVNRRREGDSGDDGAMGECLAIQLLKISKGGGNGDSTTKIVRPCEDYHMGVAGGLGWVTTIKSKRK